MTIYRTDLFNNPTFINFCLRHCVMRLFSYFVKIINIKKSRKISLNRFYNHDVSIIRENNVFVISVRRIDVWNLGHLLFRRSTEFGKKRWKRQTTWYVHWQVNAKNIFPPPLSIDHDLLFAATVNTPITNYRCRPRTVCALLIRHKLAACCYLLFANRIPSRQYCPGVVVHPSSIASQTIRSLCVYILITKVYFYFFYRL